MNIHLPISRALALSADLHAGAIAGDIRLDFTDGVEPIIHRRWSLDYLHRQPAKTAASILEAAGRNQGARQEADDGIVILLPDGGHVMVWPEGIFFRDADGNEDGSWFTAEIETEPARTLAEILQRLGESLPAAQAAAA